MARRAVPVRSAAMTSGPATRETLPWKAEHGIRLREARQRRGETQAEVAARFGVTQPSYSRWELGQTSPSGQHLDELSRFMGMEPDDFARLLQGTADPLDAVRAQLAELQREVAELRAQLGRTRDR